MIKEWLRKMGSLKKNLLRSALLLTIMGIFAVLTIFIVVDAINKKYYNDIKVEYEVQEEEDLNNVILTFARNEGSALSTSTVKAVKNPEDETKFRIDGTVPTIENGVVTNLDDLTSSDGREFYFFSTNSSFIDPQEDPENPNFIFSETDSRYYVSTEDNPIWYDVPKSSENLTLYSVFLTPNVHNSDFANGPFLDVSPNVIISHDVVNIPYYAFSISTAEVSTGDLDNNVCAGEHAHGPSVSNSGSISAKIESVVIPNSVKSIESNCGFVSEKLNLMISGAFFGCTSLQDIIIPSSVEHIGEDAFTLCTKLGKVEYENTYYIPTEDNEHALLVDANIHTSDAQIHEDCISIQGASFSKMFPIALNIPFMSEPEGDLVIEDYYNVALENISIPKNVKNIGMGAFAFCNALSSVTFEEDSHLVKIGFGSFCDALNLTQINLEDTKLEEIGMFAFGDISGVVGEKFVPLQEVTFPETLKTIGMHAFANCLTLSDVTIPGSIESLGFQAFFGCTELSNINIEIESIEGYFNSLPDINLGINFGELDSVFNMDYVLNPENYSLSLQVFMANYNGDNGGLHTTLSKNFLLTQNGEPLQDIEVPSTITKIPAYAFSFLKIRSVDMPNGVASIGDGAFVYCSNLTSVSNLDEIVSIGDYAFYRCSSFAGFDTIPSSVVSIGDYAFYLSAIKIVSIEADSKLEYIGDYAFYDCEFIESNINLPGVVSIGDYAFASGNFNNLSIGESSMLVSIGDRAFAYSNFNNLSIGESSMLESIGDGAFYDSTGLYSFTFSESLVSVGANAFRLSEPLKVLNISNLESYLNAGYGVSLSLSDDAKLFINGVETTELVIPEGVTSIPSYAFYGFDMLTSVSLPSSVETIETYSFGSCDKLNKVSIKEDSKLTSIGNYAFQGCNISSITIPKGVNTIGNAAFNACLKLVEVCNLSNLSIRAGNSDHGYVGDYAIEIRETTESGIYYAGENDEYIMYEDLRGKHYLVNYVGEYGVLTLPTLDDNQTYTINERAFYENNTITSIVIPECVTSIGSYAFYGCYSLAEIFNLSSLDITLDYGNGGIGSYAIEIKTTEGDSEIYYAGDNDEYVMYKDKDGNHYLVKYLGEGGDIELPTLKEGQTYSIKERAFSENRDITSVVIPEGVTKIYDSAFYGSSDLTSITIPSSITYIGTGVFTNMSVEEVYVGNLESYLKSLQGYESAPGGRLYVEGKLVTDLVLPDNIATIPDWAFLGAEDIVSVTIPEGVTSIGSYAFSGCTSLTSVTIPDSVTDIGDDAFRLCSSLESVNIGENSRLQTIGSSAFHKCSNLTSFTIPSSVTSIGDSAFEDCYNINELHIGDVASYLNIVFENWSSWYAYYSSPLRATSRDVNLYVKGELLTDLVIPEEVDSIPFYAFHNVRHLSSVTIPNSVTSIGTSAFYGCNNLTSITIPESVKSIGSSAFYGCTKLIEVCNLSSLNITAGSTNFGYVGYYAKDVRTTEETGFYRLGNNNEFLMYEDLGGNHYLVNYLGEGGDITLPTLEEGQTYEIYQYAFLRCGDLISITIQEGVTSIGNYAFQYCSGLISVVIPNSVVSIGRYAFDDCSSLETVTFGENSQLTSIGEGAFSYCSSLTSITIPDSVTSIGEDAFEYCRSLTSITIPDSVTSIESSAFRYCSSLTSITIPDSVTSIGEWAFYGCSSLTSITIPDSVTSIGYSAFYSCRNLTSITIPKSVTSIGDYAFEFCYKLVEVYDLTGSEGLNITAGSWSHGYVGYYADYVYTDTNSPLVQKEVNNDYIFYYNNGVMSLLGYIGSHKKLTLPSIDEVKKIFTGFSGDTYEIYEYAFCENTNITSVVIPNCVTSIGDYAFYYCSSLTSITIPDSVTSIGDSAFYYCSSLTSITIPNSVTSIGDSAFYYCDSLSSITIPDSVTSIGYAAFSGCSSLTSITIPDRVTSIGEYAFSGCSSLTSITIPDSVTSIGSYAFRYCDKLTIYCEAESQPGWWSLDWNYDNCTVYWAGEWKMVDGVPVPIESGVEGVGYSDVGEDFGIGFDGLGFREEIYFNDKRERKVV